MSETLNFKEMILVKILITGFLLLEQKKCGSC